MKTSMNTWTKRFDSQLKKVMRTSCALSLLTLCFSSMLVSCAPSLDASFSPFATPNRKIETTTLWVDRTAPACLKSLDQSVEVCLPPLSLDESQELSLSRIDLDESQPEVVGHRYQLEPSGLVLQRPARWRFSTTNFPTVDSRETLRVARSSQNGSSELWQALDKPQRKADALYGRSDQTGVFAVVDSSWVDIYHLSDFALTSEADVMLADGDIDAARAAYNAIINNDAENYQARLGRALCRILELPDSPPIRDLLTRCQLAPLSHDLFFAPKAYTDQVAQDLSGELNLQINYGASSQQVQAETVVSRSKEGVLTVRGEERDDSAGNWDLTVKIDLAQAGSDFVVGHNFAASSFPGHISWKGTQRNYTVSDGAAGSVYIEAAGRSTGQKLRLRFDDVVLTDMTGLNLHMDGLLDDIVFKIPRPNHPLFTTADDAGPPYRSAMIRLIDACDDSVTWPYLFRQAQAFSTQLNDISEDLRAVLSAVVAGELSADLQPALPSFLLRSDRDLRLNARDLRMILALIDSLDAALTVAEPYLWLGHDSEDQARPLRSYIQEQSLPFRDPQAGEDSETLRQQRAFSAEMLAADLLQNFMRKATEQSLVDALLPGRSKLDTALNSLLDALQQQTQVPGLFDLNKDAVRPLLQSWVNLLEAAQQSLQDPLVPYPLDDNPGFAMQLWRFFAQPPEHQQLVDALEPEALFTADAPNSDDALACYPQACFPHLISQHMLHDQLLASFMSIPFLAGSPETCSSNADCLQAGLSCNMTQANCAVSGTACQSDLDCADDDNCLGQCLRTDFSPIPETVQQDAWRDGRPLFLDPLLWQVFAPMFAALPKLGLHVDIF